MYVGPKTANASQARIQINRATKPAEPAKLSKPVELALKGYKAAKVQSSTLASVSTNLRIGGVQLRKYLSTGWISAMGTAGMYAGLAAAGLRAAGATEKLYTAFKKREIGPALDGVRDLGSAAVLGLAASGKWALRRTVLPIYAGFSTFRGAFNYIKGHIKNDKALKKRSALDTLRSAGLTARSLKKHSKILAFTGTALAPVVGVMETAQGIQNLSTGLEKNNNKLELKGVVDITSALGTTLLLTGIAATPGMAIFGVSQFAYTVYNMSSKVRKVMDRGIDKVEPAALKARDGIREVKKYIKESWDQLKDPFGKSTIPSSREQDETDHVDPMALRLEDDAWELFLTQHQDPEFTADPTLHADLADEPGEFASYA